MKILLLFLVLLSLLINQTTFVYALTKTDTKIADNKVKLLNERIKKGTSYETIYKQQLLLQNNIKKNRDRKNIKSITYKNLDKNYTISQYILENLINYGAVKQNTISNLPVKIQDTIIIQQQTVIKKQNCENGWYYNEGAMSCQPNNPTRSCNISNGIGKEIWNGNNWNTCTITSCNSGYSISNGRCLINQSTQQIAPITNQPSCSSTQHLENNICVSNSKSCTVSNGVGQQTWSSGIWGSCTVSSCNTGYSTSGNSCIQNQPTCSSTQHLENNICVSNSKSCTVSNGVGQQSWNSNAWGSCTVSSCNTGYSTSGSSCVQNQLTCSSDQHIENNTCVSNTKSCTVSNGIGETKWELMSGFKNGILYAESLSCTSAGCFYILHNGQQVRMGDYVAISNNSTVNSILTGDIYGWSNCTVSSCNSGYSTSGNSCIQNQPTCSSDQHIENNTCVSNTKSCSISNGYASQTWSSGIWGSCNLTSCGYGFIQENNTCKYTKPRLIQFQDNIGNIFDMSSNESNNYGSIVTIKQGDTLSIKINTLHPLNEGILCYYTFAYEQGSALNGLGGGLTSKSLTECNSSLEINKTIGDGKQIIFRLIIKAGALTNMDQIYNFGSGDDKMVIAYDIIQ